jgi:hypothetical protein
MHEEEIKLSAPAVGHPRTVFDAGELGRLQDARTGSHQHLANVLKQTLDRYKNCQSIGIQGTGDCRGGECDAGGSGCYEGIAGYAIATLIFGGRQPDPEYSLYLGVAKRSLLAMGDGTREGDLIEAEYIRNLAIGYDVLYSELSGGDQATCRTRLANAANHLATCAADTQCGWWTTDLVQNHNWVNYAAIGLAGFALLGEDPRAPDWINLAIANSEKVKYVQNLVVDGSWHEGIGYLEFGLSSSVPYWMAARRGGYQPDDSALLRNLGRYILAAQLPGNPRVHIMIHADWNWSRPGLVEALQYAATRYRDPFAQEAVRRWETDTTPATQRSSIYQRVLFTALQYIAYDPTVPTIDVSTVPLDFYASDQEAVILRSGWDATSTVLGFKCGVMGGRANYQRMLPIGGFHDPNDPGGILNIGHDHVDDLGIWLYGNGGWFLIETPAYNCCTPLDTRFYSTQYHNSFLIEGVGQYGDERNLLLNSGGGVDDNAVDHPWFFRRDASMPIHLSTAHYAFARGDGSKLYHPAAGVQSILRTVVLARDGYAALHDRLRLSSPHLLEQLFHFQLSAAQEGSVWIKGVNENDHVLGVRVFSPAIAPISPGPQHSNKCYSLHSRCLPAPFETDFTLVKVRPTTNLSNATFLELLWPTNEANWSTRPQPDPLDMNHPERGFSLPLGNTTERWLYNEGTGTTEAAGMTIKGAEIGIARTNSTGGVERVVLLGRGRLTDQSNGSTRTLLATSGDGVVEVTLSTTRADMSGTQVLGVRFHGPNVTEVWANGHQVSWRREGPIVIITSEPPTTSSAVAG